MLTILSVAYPLATVCEDAVGGAEQIVAALDAAIVGAGHRSIVVATEGSTCRGNLLATRRPTGALDAAAVHACHESCREQIARALAREEVDIVHMHGVDFVNCMPAAPRLPVLATLHLWPSVYPAAIFTAPPHNLHLQCVSEAQRQACPSAAAISVIPNGVDVGSFFSARERGDFALVLGRICPEKGVHLAIDAARQARMRIVIAGSVFPYPEHQQYFERQIKPRLAGDATFVGPLDSRTKRCVLSKARCLVLPSLARETSSLVAMEALASGAPVVALRSPALDALIEPGQTGWLVDAPEDLATALAHVDELSSAACRAHAEAHCSAAAMTRRYLDMYAHLAAPPPLSDGLRSFGPSISGAVTAQTLTSIGDFQRIESAWRLLAHASPWATPFQDPEWLVPWMQHLSCGCVCGVALWRRGRLLGLAPLVIASNAGRRVLRFAGTGVSDYLGPLVASDEAGELCARLMAAMVSRDFDCDRIEFSQMPPTHPLLARLPNAAQIVPGDPCSVLNIGDGLPRIPRTTQAILRDRWHHAEHRKAVCVEHVSAETIDEMREALFALHSTGRQDGSDRIAADSASRCFHAEAIRRLHERGTLRMTAVRIGGAVAAVTVGMQRASHAYLYAAASAAAWQNVSPRVLAIAAHVEQAARDGAYRFNFPGAGDAYRHRWGAIVSPTASCLVECPARSYD